MSIQRTFIAAIAAFTLATGVFAAEAAAPKTAATPAKATTPVEAPAGAKINLNTATAKQLEAVKGMTASKVKAIMSYRKKQGEFKTLDDLKNVKGFKRIDEATLKSIEDQLTLG